ncbi:MAG: 50S ribosomal protein L19 [Proteobacteria bacterium]|nr:50S ribosomal protein L19 [Pseudomonadota bacterium]
MKSPILQAFETKQHSSLKKDIPLFRSGDTVKVHYKIEEKQDKPGKLIPFADRKFRVQAYQGVVIKRKNDTLGGASATFTVRKIASGGIGVERTFPLYSPYIESIEVISRGIVRRARLYYLRKRFGKAARIKQRTN